jgi:hypothetical protein
MKINTSSKTSHREKPNKNRENMMPSMQRFELYSNDTNKLFTREPLLIVRLLIIKPCLLNTMRPVRKKPYQDHTFSLRIPLELDDDGLDFFKLEHLS